MKMLLNYIRKKKGKEIQKHTERNTLHINSRTGDFVIWKPTMQLHVLIKTDVDRSLLGNLSSISTMMTTIRKIF